MERLDPNTQDGLQAAVDGAQRGNYLGDPEVVGHLVGEFFSKVFAARARWHENGDDVAATSYVERLCRDFAATFMGQGTVYSPQPWNAPGRLGVYLRAVTPDVADYDTPAEAYFNYLATQALEASINLEAEAMTEAEVQAGMVEVVGDAVDVLLGRKEGIRR